MFSKVKVSALAAVIITSATTLLAKENVGMQTPPKITPPVLGKMAACAPATQQSDLDVNNVRTTILNGGDMWWNLSNARYEIPKVQAGQVAKHSLFSGALWIGGVSSGNLKLAAQTYRQSGSDFYPGPLTLGTATVNGNGTITYVPGPGANANAPDSFCYVICDNGVPSLCDTATVHISIINHKKIHIYKILSFESFGNPLSNYY